MKKFLFAFIIVALFIFVTACDNNILPIENFENEIIEVSLSEQIQGIHGFLTRVKHGDNVVYLFGEVSAARQEWFPLASIVEGAMQNADVFFVNDDPNIDPLYQEFLARNMSSLPVGVTLTEYLPINIVPSFLLRLATHGYSYNMINTLYPHIILQTFVSASAALQLGDSLIIRDYIWNFAQTYGLPVYAFFEPSWSLEVRIPSNDYIQFSIAENTPSRSSAIEQLNAMLDAYEQQDEAQLFSYLRWPLTEYTNAYERYLEELVLLFAEEYAFGVEYLLLMTENPTTFFVVVNVDNLIGFDEGNIAVLLERRGFAVERLFR